MISNIWRFFVALFDLRGLARFLTGRPAVDVVFITNLRDEAERRRYFGNWIPPEGHANGPRIHLQGVVGRVRGIYVTAEEMLTKEGRKKAKQQFIAATAWAERNGARVVLLAASTKRLFGRDGRELKERFPKLLFTIGDNGTAHMLCADIFRGLQAAKLSTTARIMVIGPYGILGEGVTSALCAAGYEVVGYGANGSALEEVAAQHGIAVATDIADIGKVDAVVACTHSSAAKLTPPCVQQLRRSGRKLLVIDVAEPANLDVDAYATCRNYVVRQDAGNAYSSQLGYVLGPVSWSMLMLSRGVVFGCFAEAMALYHSIYRGAHLGLMLRDWFVVSAENTQRVAQAFANIGFELPTPRCFGRPVASYDLTLAAAESAWSECSAEPAAYGTTTANMLPLPGVERICN